MGLRLSNLRTAALAALVALVPLACSEDNVSTRASVTASQTSATGEASGGFAAARCEANKAAGQITFLTSFDYAAAASIIDVVAAESQGYFADVCLDVKLQAGFSTANVSAVAAGQAQMTSLGSFSEVVVANAADAGLVAVAVEGQTSIEALLVENDAKVTKLADLNGRKIGIKGGIPFSIRAMLAKAGVDEKKLTQIEVDFNPVLLFETEIEALPVYKSNEPGQLDAQGYKGKYQTFDPADEKIPASFAVFTTSADFAKKHPTAVADFLRASLKGFEWADANPAEGVKATLAKSDPKLFFSPEGEAFRWETERALVRSSTPAGKAIGTIDPARLQAEVDNLVSLGVIPKDKADVKAAFDTSFIDEVTEGDQVIWLS